VSMKGVGQTRIFLSHNESIGFSTPWIWYLEVGTSISVGYVLYSLHVCVWTRQIRQLRLTIPLVVPFVLCVSGAFGAALRNFFLGHFFFYF
jgi:hypothetical protein